jgi:hypothetical protein
VSRLVFRNRTVYPDDEVQEVVRFALAGLDLPSRSSIVVRVSHTRVSGSRRRAGARYLYVASGHAYPFVYMRRDVPDGAAWEIHLRVGRPDDFPGIWHDRYEVGFPELRDWREGLVAIAAHEGKHIEAFQHGRMKNGRAGEARCETYALARLNVLRAKSQFDESAGGIFS